MDTDKRKLLQAYIKLSIYSLLDIYIVWIQILIFMDWFMIQQRKIHWMVFSASPYECSWLHIWKTNHPKNCRYILMKFNAYMNIFSQMFYFWYTEGRKLKSDQICTVYRSSDWKKINLISDLILFFKNATEMKLLEYQWKKLSGNNYNSFGDLIIFYSATRMDWTHYNCNGTYE